MDLLKEVAKAVLGADSQIEGQMVQKDRYESQKEGKEETPLKGKEAKVPPKEHGISEREKGRQMRQQMTTEGQVAPIQGAQVIEVDKTEVLRQPVVEQVIKPRELIEVQPVVTREREQTEVHEVIKPLHEREILQPVLEEKQLPEIRSQVVEPTEKFEREYNEMTEKLQSTVHVEDVERDRIVLKPVVNEVIKKHVVEQIQPVIQRETEVPRVVLEKQPVHEKIVEAPKLVQETFEQYNERHKNLEKDIDLQTRELEPIYSQVIKPKELVEVQPVITREREQTEVHQVTKPVVTREVLPAVIEEKQLPAQEREVVRESRENFEREYLSSQIKPTVEVEEAKVERVLNAPIVQEVIHKRVIEEVQPVIHRETLVPHIVKEFLPIHEKIIEAPTLYREELEETDLGTSFQLKGTSSVDLAKKNE